MTKSVDRPKSVRRREQLVEAGVALLTEGGWPAVTSRAVAERAGANLALIHYHFGGLPGLHVAIAGRAGELVIDPLLAELLAAADERAALGTVRRVLPMASGDNAVSRLTVELVAGGLRTPRLGEVVRDQLRSARGRIAAWLRERHPGWPPERCDGAAVAVAALLDGLVLHLLLDPELAAGQAVDALSDLIRALE